MTIKNKYTARIIENSDDIGSNDTNNKPMVEIADIFLSRRNLIKTTSIVGAAAFLSSSIARFAFADNLETLPYITFEGISHGIDETHHIAKGYNADILLRWGDPIIHNASSFDLYNQTASAQKKQFGYNCDFIGYFPLPAGSQNSNHGLLCVNHEYTNAELMFSGLNQKNKKDLLTKQQIDVEMMALGHSIVEIKKTGMSWAVVSDSSYNRRITLADTKMLITGPAAKNVHMQTSQDPKGVEVIGTLNNCAGGVTPWGTVLIAEENFNNFFGGTFKDQTQTKSYERYGLKEEAEYPYMKFYDRFDLSKHPNEVNRFGWMVEIDPYDPNFVPRKRTALGRFKHEGAGVVLNKDGHIVVYMGDDERFEYIYKFVSKNKFIPTNRHGNIDILDDGILYVAKFSENGKMVWLPLLFNHGPLTPENGFENQGDVVIHARKAADLMGATPMDRPEDVEANPVNGRVYAILTNNTKRTNEKIDAVNPRANNQAGHIIEMIPPGGIGKNADHTALEYQWDIFILAGDPSKNDAKYGATSDVKDWFLCPDNCTFDQKGRLWIATDQGSDQAQFGIGDGLYVMETEGSGKAIPQLFYRVPKDAEMCGPCFTPDNKTMFVAVQHPGEGSTFDNPSTRWPDFNDKMVPRPSVVVLTKQDKGIIGS
ncbi:MAG: PhoX family phosphatase [Alphaproteobacteria bacterium]|nr:PhoX family phosphatase [Alphaproteobacteria bacterium]